VTWVCLVLCPFFSSGLCHLFVTQFQFSSPDEYHHRLNPTRSTVESPSVHFQRVEAHNHHVRHKRSTSFLFLIFDIRNLRTTNRTSIFIIPNIQPTRIHWIIFVTNLNKSTIDRIIIRIDHCQIRFRRLINRIFFTVIIIRPSKVTREHRIRRLNNVQTSRIIKIRKSQSRFKSLWIKMLLNLSGQRVKITLAVCCG